MRIIKLLRSVLKFAISIFPIGIKNFLLSLNDLSSSTFFIYREDHSIENPEIFVKNDNSLKINKNLNKEFKILFNSSS